MDRGEYSLAECFTLKVFTPPEKSGNTHHKLLKHLRKSIGGGKRCQSVKGTILYTYTSTTVIKTTSQPALK